MKKLAQGLVVLAAVGLLAAAAQAECDADNCFGIYFDVPDYQVTYIPPPAPFTEFNVYFVLRQPTVPAIASAEFRTRVDSAGPITFLGQTYPSGGVGGPEGIVYQQPLLTGEPTLMATWHLILLQPVNLCRFFIGPPTNPHLPGQAAIQDGPQHWVPLTFAGDPESDGFTMVARWEVVVPVESTVWSTVKALYR